MKSVLILVLLIAIVSRYANGHSTFQMTGINHPQKSGQFPTKIVSYQKRPVWNLDSGNYESLSLAGNKFYALEKKTERTVSEDVISLGVEKSSVYAYDLVAKKKLFKQVVSNDECNLGPVVGPSTLDSVVVVCSGTVIAIDPITGTIAGRVAFKAEDVVFLEANKIMLAGRFENDTKSVLVVDNSLNVVRSIVVNSQGTPLVAAATNASIAFVCFDPAGDFTPCRSFNLNTGNQIWSQSMSVKTETAQLALDTTSNTGILFEKRVEEKSKSGKMTAFNLDTGAQLWSRSFAFIAEPWKIVTGVNGFIVFKAGRASDKKPAIFIIDVKTGDLKTEVEFGQTSSVREFVFYSPTSKRFVGTFEQQIYAATIDSSGKFSLLGTIEVPELLGPRAIVFREDGDFIVLNRVFKNTNDGMQTEQYLPTLFECGDNFADETCTTCAKGYFMNEQQCVQCPSYSVVLVGIALGVVFVLVVFFSVRASSKRQDPEHIGEDSTIEKAQELRETDKGDDGKFTKLFNNARYKLTPFMALIQFMHFAQMVSLFLKLETQLKIPDFALPIIAFINLFSLDIDSIGLQCELEGTTAKEWVQFLVPLSYYLIIIITFFVMRAKNVSKDHQATAIRVLIQSIRISFLGACVQAISMFDCRRDLVGWQLVQNPAVVCFTSPEWGEVATASILSLLLFVILPLIGYAYMLKRNSAPDRTPFEEQAFAFLFSDFRTPAAFFEGFILLRKLQGTLMVSLMASYPNHIKNSMAPTFFMVSLGVIVGKPFRRRRRNILEALLTFLSGFVFTAPEDDTAATGLVIIIVIGLVASIIVFVLDLREQRMVNSMNEDQMLALEEKDTLGFNMEKEWSSRLTKWFIPLVVLAIIGNILSWTAVIGRPTIDYSNTASVGSETAQMLTLLMWVLPIPISVLCFVREGRLIKHASLKSQDIPHSGKLALIFILNLYIDGVKMNVYFLPTIYATELIILAICSTTLNIAFGIFVFKRWKAVGEAV